MKGRDSDHVPTRAANEVPSKDGDELQAADAGDRDGAGLTACLRRAKRGCVTSAASVR